MSIVKDNQYRAGGHLKIAVAASVIPLPAALITKILGDGPHAATKVLITVEDAPIYWTCDGTAPVADGSAGHPANVGDNIELKNWGNIKNFQCIAQSGGSANIVVTSFFNDTGWPV